MGLWKGLYVSMIIAANIQNFEKEDKTGWPRISIVTPSYNRGGMIETAIQSVVDQNYPEVDHIIIDGGSTDGTLDVLKKYSHLRVVSEPDQGMYDALNKGLSLAGGEIIGFLNTDDYYAPNVFNKIALQFTEKPVDVVAGLAGVVEHPTDAAHPTRIYRPAQGEDRIRDTVLEPPIFNAYFFDKAVFQKIGGFDTRYKIAADRDFILRFMLGDFRTTIVDYPVYYYLHHPGSLTFDYTEDKYRNMADEHLMLSRSYLETQLRYPKSLAKSLMELRTRETIRVCAHCLRRREFKGAWLYLKQGARGNPSWLFRFIKHAIVHPIRQEIGLPYRTP
jgi:glycosyltransferase involved in cell wall biosynthesis